jgi:carboxylesterase
MATDVTRRASNKKEFTDKLKTLSLPPGVKVGALLLHGLTGMPNEMRAIEKALESIGCDVEVPMLAGHGATHKELLKTGWKDWLDSARQALNKLCERCDQVYVGGLSMGALMPVLLAVENPKVCGIVSMSPTIKYDSKNSSNPFQVLIPILDVLPFLGGIFYWTEAPPYGLKDERLVKMITKELEEAKNSTGGGADADSGFSQFRTYSGSLRQMQHLVAQVKKQAPNIKCPVLIMHSVEDTLTTVANPKILYSWLTGSSDRQIIYLEGCDHVLPADLKKEEVSYNFAAFICRVAAKEAAGS